MISKRPTTNYQRITIASWLNQATVSLKKVGINSARLDAQLLLEDTLSKSRQWILARDETEVENADLITLNKKLVQRIEHTPLAYIVGYKEFYGRKFIVDKNVLIPRPESEAIIELLCTIMHTQAESIDTIVDIGTGSGILAITAKLEYPDLKVIATDVSSKALGVAQKNAAILQAEVKFIKSDLFSSISDLQPSVLLVNLPYVPDDLVTSEEITKEPPEALFSGEDGLDHYRKFWDQIAGLKNKPKYIITESLESQHEDMTDLARYANYSFETSNTLIQLFRKV